MTAMKEAFKKAKGNVEDVAVKTTTTGVEHPQDLGTGPEQVMSEEQASKMLEMFFDSLGPQQVIYRDSLLGDMGFSEEELVKMLAEKPYILPVYAATAMAGLAEKLEEKITELSDMESQLFGLRHEANKAKIAQIGHNIDSELKEFYSKELDMDPAIQHDLPHQQARQQAQQPVAPAPKPVVLPKVTVPVHRTITVESESFGTQVAKAAGVAVVTAVAVWGTFKALDYFFGEDENTL